MLINYNITTNLEINSLMDLNKLKDFENLHDFKINDSALARELGVDRRTIRKYINGYEKPKTKNKKSCIDDYYKIIVNLLNDGIKIFRYKRILWDYLKRNYGLDCSESNFRKYISNHKELNDYFSTQSSSKNVHNRFETELGLQAQLDWKESLRFILNTGEVIEVNILALFMSNSRFRAYRLSIGKSQEILFNHLVSIFDEFGGVPKEILTDNMKTVMDEARTKYRSGKINNKFKQFADDYGFKVCPCIAGEPETKAKVESPMKILDELLAYSGDLDYFGLINLVKEINDRENKKYHSSYDTIPVFAFQKEKSFLLALPREQIRRRYSITTREVKVNNCALISYKSCSYSVPPKYVNKHLTLQAYDDKIHLYYNTTLVCVHDITNRKLNYTKEHYIDILRASNRFKEENIEEIAINNLKNIGEKYKQ